MTVLIYNHQTGRMERHELAANQALPYSGGTLTAGELRGRSDSQIVWTDRRALEAWNRTRTAWGRPIYVGYAFRRIGEGGHADQSQHYAGVSFDVAQNLPGEERDRLRELAASLGVWSYVEPKSLTPTWVHFDARQGPPACAAGYPMLREGSRGVYVATLQDALNTADITGMAVDGVFGPLTRRGVEAFQRQQGLTPDGIVGCATWQALTGLVNGLLRRTGEYVFTGG